MFELNIIMFPNKTSTSNYLHNTTHSTNPLSGITLNKNYYPLFNLKQHFLKQHQQPQQPSFPNKSFIPFHSHSTKYKKSKQKILCLKKPKSTINLSCILKHNLNKHNITPTQYISLLIHNIIFDEKTHSVCLFKDFLYSDDDGEFLKRFYYKEEHVPKMKQILTYYFTVYNVNELYPVNYISYYNKVVMLKCYFKKLKLTNRNNESSLNDKSKSDNDSNNDIGVQNSHQFVSILKHTKLISSSMMTTFTKGNGIQMEQEYNNKVATLTTQENSRIKNGNNNNINKTRNNSFSIISNERTIESILKNLNPQLKLIKKPKESNTNSKKTIVPSIRKIASQSKVIFGNNNSNKKVQKTFPNTNNKNTISIKKHKRALPIDQCLVFPKMNIQKKYNNSNSQGNSNNNTNTIKQNYKKKLISINTKQLALIQNINLNSLRKGVCLTDRNHHSIKKESNHLCIKKGSLCKNVISFSTKRISHSIPYENNINTARTTRTFKSGSTSLTKNYLTNNNITTTRNNSKTISKDKNSAVKTKTKTQNLKLSSMLKKFKK